MRILALEPYYGGSHQAFIDGWRTRSRHHWMLLTAPAHKWKWRMRHAALTFADRLRDSAPAHPCDVVFATDMLNLAEFRGLAPRPIRDLPTILYFHENQLTYPFREDEPRDLHFGFTNILSALAADAVWFNSAFHLEDFLAAAGDLLSRMPDHTPKGAVDAIRAKSIVMTPGIEVPDVIPAPDSEPRPLHIVWAARWEHDKNPEDFFAAIRILAERGVAFRLSVLGQRFRETPPIFDEARDQFADRIDHWGFLASRDAYFRALTDADVFVSTAHHEFFGLAAVEAMACGCAPLLPDRLAYPELLARSDDLRAISLYDGTAPALADALERMAADLAGPNWRASVDAATRLGRLHAWSSRTMAFDDAIAATARRTDNSFAQG
ncbi:MAG TPA: DUF3524 domain-containing protein [Phycisphaerae bacterium]|nr:DUF3524 domain-containing protein [Phycisphaerae bacterium]HRW53669.1 DUF3524 domain-containing protein [Phycisphaerae bacterium]